MMMKKTREKIRWRTKSWQLLYLTSCLASLFLILTSSHPFFMTFTFHAKWKESHNCRDRIVLSLFQEVIYDSKKRGHWELECQDFECTESSCLFFFFSIIIWIQFSSFFLSFCVLLWQLIPSFNIQSRITSSFMTKFMMMLLLFLWLLLIIIYSRRFCSSYSISWRFLWSRFGIGGRKTTFHEKS